jgi:hypothetical protein
LLKPDVEASKEWPLYLESGGRLDVQNMMKVFLRAAKYGRKCRNTRFKFDSGVARDWPACLAPLVQSTGSVGHKLLDVIAGVPSLLERVKVVTVG